MRNYNYKFCFNSPIKRVKGGKTKLPSMTGTMIKKEINSPTRRAFLGAFASIAVLPAAPVYANVFGYLKGAGNIRQISMRSQRFGESLNIIYWIDGSYISPALKEISWLMRDWRTDETAKMDPRNIDTIAAVQNLLETSEPFTLLSGYRTEATNAYLRARSRRVAKDSYHVKAMAADIRMNGRSVKDVARAAQKLGQGGVGRYYRSNFVHMDSGPIRHWRG